MHPLAAGFWGAFFGTAVLMLAVSLFAYARSHRRVALMAGASALVSAAFVGAFLGGLPLDSASEARVLAQIAVLSAAVLALMLLALLGLVRSREGRARAAAGLFGGAVLVSTIGWTLAPSAALALGCAAALGLGLVMLAIVLRRALRGDPHAWLTVSGTALMLAALAGLSFIALDRSAPLAVHAASALAGMAYLAVMASALWVRYSYLIELSEVVRHGPSYDPVTRMRSHSGTGQMVGAMFTRQDGVKRPIGVIAICIANLYALENLHGRAAFNHALFIYAGRLRRCVPQAVEMGRLGDDGFLLMLRGTSDMGELATLARTVRRRLAGPVALSTTRDMAGLDRSDTAWLAELGIGVLGTSTEVRPAQAVSTARAMARTAWSYGSRLAFFDEARGRIAELPLDPEPEPGGFRLAAVA